VKFWYSLQLRKHLAGQKIDLRAKLRNLICFQIIFFKNLKNLFRNALNKHFPQGKRGFFLEITVYQRIARLDFSAKKQSFRDALKH